MKTETVRVVRLIDVPELAPHCAAWLYEEWGYRKPDASLERSVEKFRRRSNSDRLPIAFVAVSDDIPVGTASLVETEDLADTVGPWVGSLFVIPEYRGRGIARKLLEAVEQEAIRFGIERLWLSAAVPELYRKAGYEFTAGEKHGEPVMVKSLTSL